MMHYTESGIGIWRNIFKRDSFLYFLGVLDYTLLKLHIIYILYFQFRIYMSSYCMNDSKNTSKVI
jgi:hypothetical protein